MSKPPAIADLAWKHGLVFDAASGSASLVVDGDSREGASPVQMLAIALAGCMAVDLVHILGRGRHPLRALRSRIVADRSPDDPHRVVRVLLQFIVEGAVPREAIDRAIDLSRRKYCSVWHSMREDIVLTIEAEVRG